MTPDALGPAHGSDDSGGGGAMMPTQIGPYKIEKVLGVGGMAVVYLGYKSHLSSLKVAIKVPSAALLTQEVVDSFKREAEAVVGLSTDVADAADAADAIVPLQDYDVLDDGRPYFVMRYMRGGSLADWLDQGPLSLEQACAVIDRIAQALDDAHSRNIIHRDIKPGNILFDKKGERGKAYLSDFGIALSTDPDGAPPAAPPPDNPDATFAAVSARSDTEGTFMALLIPGTRAYMSEESRHAGIFDRRSDVYSLGVVLRQMLTGRQPDNPDDVGSDADSHVNPPAPLPPPVQAVIDRAVAANPDDRYQTAGALAAALRAAAGRRPWPRGGLAAVVALVALALTLVVWGVWRDRRPSPRPTPIPAAIAAVTTAAVAATDTAIAANATVLAAAGTDVAAANTAVAAANTSEAAAATSVAETFAAAAPALTAMAATDTPSPSSTAVTPTATDTPTVTPTSTSTATATSAPPPNTPSGPPTLPPPPAVVARTSLLTRTGPGMEYPTGGGGMLRGEVAPALAHDGLRLWYLVLLDGRAFWAPASLLAPADGSSLEGVGPAATIPPPPTATFTPPPPPPPDPPTRDSDPPPPPPAVTPTITPPCTNPPFCGL